MGVDLPVSDKDSNLLEILVEGTNHKNTWGLDNDKKGLHG